KKVEEAIATGDKKAAQEALRAAQPEIQRGAIKRIVTKNAASRRVSRLSARIKAMA
ncbi:MAG: 30S ribosomal protein S20, partial [Reyranella sp.]